MKIAIIRNILYADLSLKRSVIRLYSFPLGKRRLFIQVIRHNGNALLILYITTWFAFSPALIIRLYSKLFNTKLQLLIYDRRSTKY